ncbi:hypothetical protein WG922_19765 [Ramlibacter sp. AN1015]|uniref:hypothetical protein n=1 Tax=Ramlibacter sp. AN1015 TaxID=3133428 RepID=UPI0030C45B22
MIRKAAESLRPHFRMEGAVGGRPFVLQEGLPTRDYIHRRELLGRCDLALPPRLADEVSVVLMNRHLKSTLEQSAYERYIDDERTLATTGLPEEMRWLSVYRELRWPQLPREFWRHWTVLADHAAHAASWVDAPLAAALMEWPRLAPDTPVVLLLLRGKVYLRVQYSPREPVLARHAGTVLQIACESGQRAWGSTRRVAAPP